MLTLTASLPSASRVLRMHEVTKAIGLSKASIYRLMKLNRFPKSFKIGIAAVGWDLAEIEFWIFEQKMANSI
jgi:prophage regulatory protein